jgi:cellobiose-specific phosphotransferase system component IIC
MTRDAEQRLIAAITLVVVGVAAVGLSAWILAAAGSDRAIERVLLGSVAVAVGSIAAGPAAMALGDQLDRDWAMVARRVTLLVVAGLIAETVALLVVGAAGPVALAATVLSLVAFWVVLPLSIGAVSATTGGASMLSVLVAWPGTNVLALALFVAPTPGGIDFGRDTALALPEPLPSAVLLAVAVTVAVGPTLLGTVIDRWVRRP